MAERRMLSKTLVDSDEFLDMPVSTQNLYFHLNLRADDEGFIDNPKTIMRTVSAGNNDLDILLAKRYILKFESGVIVIKHWKLHNSIRKDRFKETLYKEEKKQIVEKENGVYTDNLKSLQCNDIEDVTTNGQPNDNQMTTNGMRRLGKDRVVEDRIEEKEKINKKEISNSQPFQPYNPNQNLHTMIQEMIDHWNKQPNLPKCRYQSITIPKLNDIIPKFDIFEEIEMYESIVNLNALWNDIDSRYRTSSFSNFYANDTIDSFVTSANPFERYEKPFNEDNMTKNESRAYTRYYIEKKNYCENWTDLREFMKTDCFIDYLKGLEDE